MKRRDLILATSGIVGGFALGCSSDGMTPVGTGGVPGSGGVAGTGGGTGGTGGTGGSGATGGNSGGSSSGGTSSGGTSSGGSSSGGTSSGGAGSGGTSSGGAGSGGGGGAVTCETSDNNTNHQHPLVVTAAMIEAAETITLTAANDMGAFPHPHPVTITAAQWAELAANGTLMVEGDDTAETHLHIWTITCE